MFSVDQRQGLGRPVVVLGWRLGRWLGRLVVVEQLGRRLGWLGRLVVVEQLGHCRLGCLALE